MSDDDDMDDLVAVLRLQFIAALPDHSDTIRRAWRSLDGGAETEARRAAAAELLHRAHRLAGGGAMVGLPAISEAAAPVEEMLRAALEGGGAPVLPAALAPLIARLVAACDAASVAARG
jgi:HPt (histidine-containing phosphotransfer) domain-containing protein